MKGCNFTNKNDIYIDELNITEYQGSNIYTNFNSYSIKVLDASSKITINKLNVYYQLALHGNIKINMLNSNEFNVMVNDCDVNIKEVDENSFYYLNSLMNCVISKGLKVLACDDEYRRVVNDNYQYGCICHISSNYVDSSRFSELDCQNPHNSSNTVYNVIPIKGENYFQQQQYYFDSLYVENNS